MKKVAPLVIVMGVAGCGKTTVGQQLSRALAVPFADADDFHSASNKQKMARGEPLDDQDRQPWLAALKELLSGWADAGSGGVLACSALRRSYRDQLRLAGGSGQFIYLRLDKEAARARLSGRVGHYMKAGMIDSQFDALEPPSVEEPDCLAVDASAAPELIVQAILRQLQARPAV